MKVMICDGDYEAARGAESALHIAGLTTLVCFTGRACLANAEGFRPDAAIVEVGLPDVDGYQVGRTLREKFGASILLIAHTASRSAAAAPPSNAAAFDHHLPKSDDWRRLLGLLWLHPGWSGRRRA